MKVHKILQTLIILLLILRASFAFADGDWDQILKNNIDLIPKIKIENEKDKNQLISHAQLDGKRNVISKIDRFLETNYDPILMSIYTYPLPGPYLMRSISR